MPSLTSVDSVNRSSWPVTQPTGYVSSSWASDYSVCDLSCIVMLWDCVNLRGVGVGVNVHILVHLFSM